MAKSLENNEKTIFLSKSQPGACLAVCLIFFANFSLACLLTACLLNIRVYCIPSLMILIVQCLCTCDLHDPVTTVPVYAVFKFGLIALLIKDAKICTPSYKFVHVIKK